MAFGALAMAPGGATASIIFQRLTFDRFEFSYRLFHFREQGGLIRCPSGCVAQGAPMSQEGGNRAVNGGIHESAFTFTPLSHPISLPRAKPATAAPSATARK